MHYAKGEKVMKILGKTLSEGVKVRATQGSTMRLSKACKLGGKHRLFFRMITDENGNKQPLVATVVGRRCDPSFTGVGFYVLENFEVNEFGQVKDLTGLHKYQNIAGVIFDAMYNKEITELKEGMEADVKAGRMDSIDEVALALRMKEIEEAYYGRKETKEVKGILPTKNRAIGRIEFLLASEAYVVHLDSESSKPDFSASRVAAINLSNKKVKELQEIAKNPEFYDGEDFLEVQFDYIGKDTKEAGKDAVLTGVPKDKRLSVLFPEIWEANKDKIEMMAADAEFVASKNPDISRSCSAKKLIETFKAKIAKTPVLLSYIDVEGEAMEYTALDLVDSGLLEFNRVAKENIENYIKDKGLLERVKDADKEEAGAKDVADFTITSAIGENVGLNDAVEGIKADDSFNVGDIDDLI